jgi:hypothetical protein
MEDTKKAAPNLGCANLNSPNAANKKMKVLD